MIVIVGAGKHHHGQAFERRQVIDFYLAAVDILSLIYQAWRDSGDMPCVRFQCAAGEAFGRADQLVADKLQATDIGTIARQPPGHAEGFDHHFILSLLDHRGFRLDIAGRSGCDGDDPVYPRPVLFDIDIGRYKF